jgi:hypothetical protein
MWWIWPIAIVWAAAGLSGFMILYWTALENSSKKEKEKRVDELGGFVFLFFAVLGPFVWLMVWRRDISEREKRNETQNNTT